jgi:type II secretory pathway pseudopilin PulG
MIGCAVLAVLSIPCTGVVAAIAIPAFVSYTRRAKTAEARASVAMIRSAVEAECTSAGGVLPDALAPTLASPGPARQVVTLDPRWSRYGLGGDPLYYAYAIERPDAHTAVVVAEGDLDGDGTRSRYASTCTTDGASGGCSCGELDVTNELE